MNLIFAFALVILATLMHTAVLDVSLFADMAARLSVYLAVFNLIPVPPLDGSKILVALRVPYVIYSELARFGFVLLLLAYQLTPLGAWINNASSQITYDMYQAVRFLG
jgi:Zn-dependent protease